jgi:hypothetical protein
MKKTSIYVCGRYPVYVDKIKRDISNLNLVNWIICSDPNKAEIILSFDNVYLNLSETSSNAMKVLVRQEPYIVAPENYSVNKLEKFNLILSAGSIEENDDLHLDWPQQFSKIIDSKTARISNRQIMINSNLFSIYRGENYSLRRKAVSEINSIDLFGYGWSKSLTNKLKNIVIEVLRFVHNPGPISFSCASYYFSKPLSYMGPVANKFKEMSKYQISIVIENCNNYMSEKIFDSFFSGTIPVYVGPNLDIFGVPSNLYFNAEQTINGIKEALESANKCNYTEWKSNLDLWLNHPETIKKWSDKNFISNLNRLITNSITSNTHSQH